jgi:hypothetical protein
MRFPLLLCVLLAFGCAASLQEQLARLGPMRAEEPLTPEDTLIGLVLAQAALHGTVDFHPRHQVVVENRGNRLTPHAIPRSDSLTFFVLDTAQIQHLADRTGDFSYLRVYVPRIAGDTAHLGIGSSRAFRHRSRPVLFLGGGACSLTAVRRAGSWEFIGHTACIIG